MTTLPFIKVHGCSNDFMLVCRDELTPVQRKRFDALITDPNWVRGVCDRRAGVGADGALVIERLDGQWSSTIINADGSPGGMCGNGLRCIALYLMRTDQAKTGQAIPIRMGGRTVEVHIERDDPFQAALDLGRVQLDRISDDRALPTHSLEELAHAFPGSTVSVAWAGNPHAIVIAQDTSLPELSSASRSVRSSGLFREGVNITVAAPIDRSRLLAQTDERGVGPTQACASGAAALAAAAYRAGLVDATCSVQMPGGSLRVELSQDSPQNHNDFLVRIAGGAEIVYRAELPISVPPSGA